jgi:GWxTD domain-containing protein
VPARSSVLLVSVLSVLLRPCVEAQPPRGTDTLSARAVAESLQVLSRLEAAVRRAPKDAALQHKLGWLAFTLQQRTHGPGAPPSLNSRVLRRQAEAALFAALDLEPDNPAHYLALGRFFSTDFNPERASRIYYDRGLAIARELQDTMYIAEIAYALGLQHWLHASAKSGMAAQASRELLPGGAPTPDNPIPSPGAQSPQGFGRGGGVDLAGEGPLAARTVAPNTVVGAAGGFASGIAPQVLLDAAHWAISQTIHPMGGISAESFYLNAESYTREAFAIRGADPWIFRQLAGAMLIEKRWSDMEALAREHAVKAPHDAWGWMTLGLAQHRQGASTPARAAFDRGLSLLDPAERTTLDRIDRIMSPPDSAAFLRADSATRTGVAEMIWKLSDPLWSEDEEDTRVEFLARITHAELLYGRDGSTRHGYDTPSGQLLVRYGPPDETRGQFWLYNSGLVIGQCMRMQSVMRDSDGQPVPSNTRCPEDLELLNRILVWMPAQWDNIARVAIDPIPTNVARFRVAADSVDVLFAARAPLGRLRSAGVANAPIRTRFWLYEWGTAEARPREVALDSTGFTRWAMRVRSGAYYYRMEAMAAGTLVAARADASAVFGPDTVNGLTMRGFGVSDVVLATDINTATRPERWSDAEFTPLLGSLARGTELGLVWETYELARRNGSAQYEVTIDLERQSADAGRVVAKIVRGIGEAVGVRASGNRTSMHFTRTVPYASAIVDQIVLDLGASPAGFYRMTVTVKDVVSGRRASRVLGLTLVDGSMR